MKPSASRKFGLISSIGAAFAAAGSVRAGQRPHDADLIALGIDPVQFRSIRKI